MEEVVKFARGSNGYDYPYITGDNYFCVPTCLEMTAISMGYRVDSDKIRSYFPIITQDETDVDNELGVHLSDGDLDKIFTEFQIPLFEQYIPINHIAEFQFTDLIVSLLESNAHILCGYSFGYLFHDNSLLNIGHASIILSVDGDYVKILNPGPKFAGINKVREDDLYSAIRYKQGGLWVLKSK